MLHVHQQDIGNSGRRRAYAMEDNMKEIPLTQGKVALVDDEDYDRLVAMGKWYAMYTKHKWYAMKTIQRNGKGYKLLLHRFIMDVVDPKILVDHKNGNGLDNTRQNLRICSSAQNQINRIVSRNNKVGYKGVYYDKYKKLWVAEIQIYGKRKFLGYHHTPELAAIAYDDYAKSVGKEFAHPNFE
jgi:hypothetical protein